MWVKADPHDTLLIPSFSPPITTPTQPQISLLADGPCLLSLMLAGGVGVFAGSAVSPMVDVVLFRRLLILLMLLGANVMLFAGAPGRLALAGVLSVVVGTVLFILALWHQPFLLAKGNEWAASFGADSMPQRWLGKVGYSGVPTHEEDVDEAEAEEAAAGDGVKDDQGRTRRVEVEMVKV